MRDALAKLLVVLFFVILGTVAWVADDSPQVQQRQDTQQRSGKCIWWVDGKYQLVACPKGLK